MISPEEVARANYRVENKNLKFYAFLKNHADEEELDRQFSKLHAELFDGYDCGRCGNCCKSYSAVFSGGMEEIEAAAGQLGMTAQKFIDTYLERMYGSYQSDQVPCKFLEEDMSCLLGDKKPESCKKFPYTDQPGRLESLHSVMEFAGVCPVVFEIVERLKVLYNFR